MTTTLEQAIAEVKQHVAKGYILEKWPECIDVVFAAVASGDLIPLSDHKLAVALAYQRAADGAFRAAFRHEGATPASPPWYEEFWAVRRDAILALADQDDLAEVQALRKARDNALKEAMYAAAMARWDDEGWPLPEDVSDDYRRGLDTGYRQQSAVVDAAIRALIPEVKP